jgi:hypothetical protein
MIQALSDLIWRAIERIYDLPDDLFDFEDDENAIIED